MSRRSITLWGRRSNPIWMSIAAALGLLIGVLGPSSSPAYATVLHFAGPAPGAITCALTAKVTFSPPVANPGGGTNPSTVKGRLSQCTANNPTVTIASGILTGSFSRSPLACSPLTSTGASSVFSIKWTGDVNTPVFTGHARFDTSSLSYSGEQLVTSGTGDIGITLPGGGSSTASGSFGGGGAFATLYSSESAAALTTACSTKGVKSLILTGTAAINGPHEVVSLFAGPGITFPDAITSGADGNLWFTNNKSIGRITPAGVVSNFPVSQPCAIAAGPDGALWFTACNNSSIGRITTGGVVTYYAVSPFPALITAGPDGALWFTHEYGHSIDRITTGGVVSSYTDPRISGPQGITSGSDGNIWFTNDPNGGSIGRITLTGAVSLFSDSNIKFPGRITTGPDGNLWFTNDGLPRSHGVRKNLFEGRITAAGSITTFTGLGSFQPTDITAGPDGALWFVNFNNTIGRITTAGVVSNFAVYGTTGNAIPGGITTGPDGNLWFTTRGNNSYIGRVTP